MKDEDRCPFWISVLRPAQPVAVGEFEKVGLHEGPAVAKIEVSNQEDKDGYTPLDITTGIHRGTSIVSSPETEAAICQVMARAGMTPTSQP